MNNFHAAIYGVIQGVSEFLPVSSSGHLALLPNFINIVDPGVQFDLFMHLGTAFAVIVYFYKELLSLINGIFLYIMRSDLDKDKQYYSINFSIATISSVICILLIKDYAHSIGRSPILIASNLAFFGILLFLFDKFSKSSTNSDVMSHKGSVKKAIIIGIAQSLAIFPGVSRSGITMTLGRFVELNRYEASSFSFLLSLPIILAASIKMLPSALSETSTITTYNLLVGIFVSFIVGLLTIHFFMKLIRKVSYFSFMIYRGVIALLVYIYLIY